MNCKQGDLVVIVGAEVAQLKPHIGKIVKCVKTCKFYENSWRTDPEIREDGFVVSWHDDHLRPIRDSDKEDEMLHLIGKPEDSKLIA